MTQPTSFIFKQKDVDTQTGLVHFGYAVHFEDGSEKTFEEKIRFTNTAESQWSRIPKKTLDAMLTNLHIACGVSYYKAYCPKKIEIEGLTEYESTFWNMVYTKGLGEFFYKNQIDFRGLVQFPSSEKSVETPEVFTQKDRSLVPFGGGKDSLVSVELLKKADRSFSLFMINPVPLQLELAKKVGADMILVERTLDSELLRLSREGVVLNGHVPISTIYLFTGLLAAALHNFKYVVFSNEASANIGNVEYLDEEINHQWSKSLEAEMLIRSHIQQTITEDITPFSILRPFSELEITQDFVRHPEYFSLFSSCNRNFAITEERRLHGEKPWCGECPKCAFVFLMLAAFLKPETVVPIFGKNLFEDEKLIPTYKALLGYKANKPFECVGTPEECRGAFSNARTHFGWGETKACIMEQEETEAHTFDVLSKINFNRQPDKKKYTSIPFVFRNLFRRKIDTGLPIRQALEQTQKFLLLGYGMEGKATEKYLKTHFPDAEILTADKKDGPDYLEKQNEADLVIKTPGIPKNLVTRPYMTATNIFFSYCKNPIISVTGSKGKSTTAALIAHLLRADEHTVHLVGNIGSPALDVLDVLKKDDIVVMELSSYMLDDFGAFSPQVSVFTSFFPEHLNYHGSLQNYFDAKAHIVDVAQSADFFVYNPKYPEIKELAAHTKAFPIETTSDNVSLADTSLKGEHNKDNIALAIAVAKLFDVKPSTINKALKTFAPLPHRMTNVGTFKGITFIDDAIATAPEATIFAIDTFKNTNTIFLGGEDRGYDFADLAKKIIETGIRNIVLFPDTGARIKKELEDTGAKNLNILETKSMEEAVRFAYEKTKKDSVCLLSMASPSYSLWKNFEEKGDEFVRWVKEVGK